MCCNAAKRLCKKTPNRLGGLVVFALLLFASSIGSVILLLLVIPTLVTFPGSTWSFAVENGLFYAIIAVLAWLFGCIPYLIHALLPRQHAAFPNRSVIAGIAVAQTITAGGSPWVVSLCAGLIPMLGPFIGIGFACMLPLILGATIPIATWAYRRDTSV